MKKLTLQEFLYDAKESGQELKYLAEFAVNTHNALVDLQNKKHAPQKAK